VVIPPVLSWEGACVTSFKPVIRPPENIWIVVCTADELCKRDQLGALAESLHMVPLKPCYATDKEAVDRCVRIHDDSSHVLEHAQWTYRLPV